MQVSTLYKEFHVYGQEVCYIILSSLSRKLARHKLTLTHFGSSLLDQKFVSLLNNWDKFRKLLLLSIPLPVFVLSAFWKSKNEKRNFLYIVILRRRPQTARFSIRHVRENDVVNKKRVARMEMSGYLRTKHVARWACLVTWEQSVLFDGNLWLRKNKAPARWTCLTTWDESVYLLDMSGCLRTKRVSGWKCLTT